MPSIRKSGVIALSVAACACSAVSAGRAQAPYQPRTLSYDSTRLGEYSTADLIDLLPNGSLTKNARQQHTMYNVLPPDRRQVETPSGADRRLYIHLPLDAHALDYANAVE